MPGLARWLDGAAVNVRQSKHMGDNLRLVAAQLNFWVGDIEGNAEKIIAAAARARDDLRADLIAFPELALLGYPPDDLLLRSGIPPAIEAGLERIRREAQGIHLVVGHPEYAEEGIYNAASVFRDGQLVRRYRKRLLPNYGVFDEKRHFLAGRSACVFDLKGVPVGLCICEDIWGTRPADESRDQGARLMVNINASPFALGKSNQREQVLRARAAETRLPILYVNMVGGQDDLLFDGDSSAIGPDGTVSFRAPTFEEDLYGVDFADGELRGVMSPPEAEEAVVYRGLVQSVRDYVTRNGFPGALIGLSGGIDSALVAAVAADALGPDRVWGVSLPSRYTLDMSNDDARIEAEALGIRYSILPIEPTFDALTSTLAQTFEGRAIDITEENMQSRSRGVLLMALSNKFGHVVLTTGNKSEMAVGYATLYGDMCGGFAPIKDVYKTLVFRLARYRNTISPVIPERVLTRPPSAELRPDQKDSDSLPPYEVLDPILEAYVESNASIPQIIAMGFEEATVKRVAGLVRRSEYKRRQAPPGPKVTRCAFGRERRYPITAVYGDF
ncbi:NAD+ synthase (glutamine-hydrolysing) [Panacagrimonas perspica]|uniref:Glutamine-dependent NAD(+) synthetase n=2 Tax=Panacagrimonas perspica TaxID=381431 RepID=A0A4R7P356_9GAMM|nr:NAD+ synthase (glutamine-hydrolysing) [Panacagrimonas perspica]